MIIAELPCGKNLSFPSNIQWNWNNPSPKQTNRKNLELDDLTTQSRPANAQAQSSQP